MPDYRDCIVSFYDVLGFREMVNAFPSLSIEQKLDALLRYGKMDPETREAFEGESYHFSDTVVRVMPLDSAANEAGVGLFFHEILDVLHVQMELVKHGVMIRGAITMGKVSFTKEQVFGPGIVRAYELESQVAQFPRIMVDPTALRELEGDARLRKDTHSWLEEKQAIRRLLDRDADGIWFVDYLRAQGEADDPFLYERMLSDHRDAISKQLSAQKRLDRTSQKLVWIARYHNRVISELGGRNSRFRALRIKIPKRLASRL